ncbi:hypothetical protein [Streptomyces sp. CC224B]|uniref:hypothetical protein n=1 Tax=Streptomyces sp. CC224B TaxID=3044571 RepID=UPI0024A9C98F|nr:hypothetical protein [Streptomyces sp. CC224B]
MALFRRKKATSGREFTSGHETGPGREGEPGHEVTSAAAAQAGPPSGPAVPDWVADADRVRPLLRVRLVRPDRLPAGPAPVSKPLLHGELLAVAEVRGAMPVLPEHLTWWGMEPAELWAVAQHNLRVHQPPVQRDGELHLLQGDPYTAAQLVRVHDITHMPADGLLAWIPAPHFLAFRRITDAEQLMHGINGFAQGRRKMETDLGGPDAAAAKWLYRDFIWCRDALAERVVAAYEEKGPQHFGLTVTGSPRFNEVWTRLGREFAEARHGS